MLPRPQYHQQPPRDVVVECMYRSGATRSGSHSPMVLDAREPLSCLQPVGASREASLRVSTPVLLHNKAGLGPSGETFITASGICCDQALLALIEAQKRTCRDALSCCEDLGWSSSVDRTRPDPVCILAALEMSCSGDYTTIPTVCKLIAISTSSLPLNIFTLTFPPPSKLSALIQLWGDSDLSWLSVTSRLNWG
jgi:hypothetical protein